MIQNMRNIYSFIFVVCSRDFDTRGSTIEYKLCILRKHTNGKVHIVFGRTFDAFKVPAPFSLPSCFLSDNNRSKLNHHG